VIHRWAIGWPTLTDAGRTARRCDIREHVGATARGAPESTSISLKWTPSACSLELRRPVRVPPMRLRAHHEKRSATAPADWTLS